MIRHTVIVKRVQDGNGVRAVVTYADDVIWISDQLMAEVKNPDRERFTGDMERVVEEDDVLISFGTPGDGLGRLTYRLTGVRRADPDVEGFWHVYERVSP